MSDSDQTLEPEELVNLLNHLKPFLPCNISSFYSLLSEGARCTALPSPFWNIKSSQDIALTLWKLYGHFLHLMHRKGSNSGRSIPVARQVHTQRWQTRLQTTLFWLQQTSSRAIKEWAVSMCQCVSVPLLLSLPLTQPPLSKTKWPDGFQSCMLIHTDCGHDTPTTEAQLCFTEKHTWNTPGWAHSDFKTCHIESKSVTLAGQ